MALPRIDTPKYDLTIPSSGKKVTFRPYTVNEEKIMLMALETKEEKAMLRAIKDIISACTFNEIKPDDLYLFDLEYIFLQIRSKSAGELVDVQIKCPQDGCNGLTPIAINLAEIKVNHSPKTNLIHEVKLSDTLTLFVRPITIRALSRIDTSTKGDKPTSEESARIVLDLLGSTFEKVISGTSSYPISSSTIEEVRDFIGSMRREQILDIQKIIDQFPVMEKEVEVICPTCSRKHSHRLKGIQSFFG